MSEAPSRIEQARRSAAGAKQIAVAAAVAGFLGFLLLVRGHGGQAATHSSSKSSQSTRSSTQSGDDGSFGFGSSSVAPSSGSAPQAQTSVS